MGKVVKAAAVNGAVVKDAVVKDAAVQGTARNRQRIASAALAAAALLGGASTITPAMAATPGSRAAAFTGSDMLFSVTATGRTNAWAVGDYFVNHTSEQEPLIERWNGHSWRLAKSPAVGGSQGGYLESVAASSARNAWAVGSAKGLPLIEHWNGSAWRVVPAARAGGKGTTDVLTAIAIAAPKSVWAVGSLFTTHGILPLIEHWNGARWRAVHAPDPGGPAADDTLDGVAASKAGVWAVGSSAPGNIYHTLVLGLVRGRWHKLGSENPSGLGNWLGAVSASGRHVLAAGFGGYDNPVAARTLVMHRSGLAFRLDRTPNPGATAKQDELYGVAATPDGGWAVGRATTQTLVLRELSGHWHPVPSPSWPSPDTSILEGVGASGKTAWAVGQYSVDVATTSGEISVSYSLILHWTGRKWVQVRSPNR
jgi:hypothetical protein